MIMTLRDSKARLSELVSKAANGEEILISVRGVPRARLVAIAPVTEQESSKKWLARLRKHQQLYKGKVPPTDSTAIIGQLREE